MTTHTASTAILNEYRQHLHAEGLTADHGVFMPYELLSELLDGSDPDARLAEGLPVRHWLSLLCVTFAEYSIRDLYGLLYQDYYGISDYGSDLPSLDLPNGATLVPDVVIITAPEWYTPAPGAELRMLAHDYLRQAKHPGEPDADRRVRSFYTIDDRGDLAMYLRRIFTD